MARGKISNAIETSLSRTWQGAGAPRSGTAADATGVNEARPGDLYVDTTNNVVYVNEGTRVSPYWTPISYDQPGIRSVWTDFNEIADIVATAGTTMSVVLRSGIRVFGDGHADTDSGLTIANVAEVGFVGTILTTDETAHMLALGFNDHTTPNMQPDVNGPIVIDVEFSHVSAITDRATFIGFIGSLIDALVEPVTGSSTTITMPENDVAGMLQDSGLSDADGLFLPHNKVDAAADIATTAPGVDLGQTIAAAATYQRWRAELAEDGDVTVFVNKVQVGTIAVALAVNEEITPVFYIAANANAIKSATIKRIAMWYRRV